MSGFVLHPEALTDLEEIWEYIATDNLGAADGVLQDILKRFAVLSPFHNRGIVVPT
jgi:plasmid stabilization system protein ParE